jgi:hypothetical protein
MVRQLKISLFGSFAGTTLKAKAAKFERDRIDYLGAVALLDPNAHVSGPDAIAANIIRAVPAERLHGMGLNDFDEMEVRGAGQKKFALPLRGSAGMSREASASQEPTSRRFATAS